MVQGKDNKLTVMVSAAELRMLRDLADEDGAVTASEVVRNLIRAAYARKFKFKLPGAKVMPTIRAIVDDISGPVHYTAGNVATRTKLPLPVVHEVLQTLTKKGVLDCVDHMRPLKGQDVRHESENWTYELIVPKDRAFTMLEKVGLDVDAEIRLKA